MAIKLTGTGDMSQITKELERVQAQIVKLREEQGKTTKEGTKGHDEWISKIADIGKAYAGPVTALMSVGGAIKTVVAFHDEHLRKLDEVASKYKDVNREVVKGLAARGQLQYADEILARMKESGQGRSINAAALSSVAGGDPIRFGETSRQALERQLPLAVEVAKQMPYADDGLGEQAGRFQRMMPGRSPQEVMRMVQYAREHVGDNMEQLTSQRMVKFVETMKGRGQMTGEQALGTAIGMLIKGQRPDKLLQLADDDGSGTRGVNGRMQGGKAAATADLQRAMEEGRIITDEFTAAAGTQKLPTEVLGQTAIGVQTEANVSQDVKIAKIKARTELEAMRKERLDAQLKLEYEIDYQDKGSFAAPFFDMFMNRNVQRGMLEDQLKWTDQGIENYYSDNASEFVGERKKFIAKERETRQIEEQQLEATKTIIRNQRAAANINQHVE